MGLFFRKRKKEKVNLPAPKPPEPIPFQPEQSMQPQQKQPLLDQDLNIDDSLLQEITKQISTTQQQVPQEDIKKPVEALVKEQEETEPEKEKKPIEEKEENEVEKTDKEEEIQTDFSQIPEQEDLGLEQEIRPVDIGREFRNEDQMPLNLFIDKERYISLIESLNLIKKDLKELMDKKNKVLNKRREVKKYLDKIRDQLLKTEKALLLIDKSIFEEGVKG